jgi:hypothetical protein
MLVPKFCAYMMNRAELEAAGKEPNQENYITQLKKAVKELESDNEKLSLYENDLKIDPMEM